MALLMSYLVAPGATGASMAPGRVLDTLLGVCVGILLAVVCPTLDSRIFLASQHQAVSI